MEIADYRDRIAEHSPCAEGLADFLAAKTRNGVFRCIMDRNCTDFFLASVRDGWGPSGNDVLRIFGRHVNGPVTEDGAAMWCRYSGRIHLGRGVRRLVLLDCGRVEVVLPESARYLKIQMAGEGSDVTVNGPGAAFVQVRRYSGTVRAGGPTMKVYDR